MPIYTKGGDTGFTSSLNGKRISKSDPLIEVIGSIDELTAYIGLLSNLMEDKSIKDRLITINNELSNISAQISLCESKNFQLKEVNLEVSIKDLENKIDEYQKKTNKNKEFIITFNNKNASLANIARTVCRRVERYLVKNIKSNKAIHIAYLNRLSDYLFILAVYLNQ